MLGVVSCEKTTPDGAKLLMRIHRFKNPVSSQTEKLMAGTKFSDYLGLKQYENAKKSKHFNHLRLANRPQSFAT